MQLLEKEIEDAIYIMQRTTNLERTVWEEL